MVLFRVGIALAFTGAVQISLAQQPTGLQYSQLTAKGYQLLSAGKYEEAQKVFRDALDLYDQDGQVWLSYGQASARANHPDQAIQAGKKVLELGAFAAKVKAAALFEMSCAACQKQDNKEAWTYLDQAMAAGFRSLDQLRKEPRLEPLHADARWEEVSASKDVSKLSRTEGWQYDLWLLDRELRRIHYAPYKLVSEKDRSAWIRRIHDDIPKLNDDQVIAEMMRYVASFGDGHTRISVPNISRPRLQFFHFGEGIYVIAAHADHRDLVGRKLVQVEGQPVESLLAKVEPLIFRDNPQGIRAIAPNYITNPVILNGIGVQAAKDKLNLTFEDEKGKTETVAVPCSTDFQPKPDWTLLPKSGEILTLKNRSKNYWYEYLPDLKAIYFQYNAVQNMGNESIAKFTERMFKEIDDKKIERLIIDDRWNGGGNTFFSQPIVLGLLQRPKISQEGGLYVITGRNTFSAAQNFTTDIARSCQATFVGEPTGSSPNFIGESIPFSLPYSKITGTISDLYWQRSWPMDDRIWIAPDLPAAPSIKAFLAGKDPAIEVIIANLKG